jgi:hypothetical protein
LTFQPLICYQKEGFLAAGVLLLSGFYLPFEKVGVGDLKSPELDHQ